MDFEVWHEGELLGRVRLATLPTISAPPPVVFRPEAAFERVRDRVWRVEEEIDIPELSAAEPDARAALRSPGAQRLMAIVALSTTLRLRDPRSGDIVPTQLIQIMDFGPDLPEDQADGEPWTGFLATVLPGETHSPEAFGRMADGPGTKVVRVPPGEAPPAVDT